MSRLRYLVPLLLLTGSCHRQQTLARADQAKHSRLPSPPKLRLDNDAQPTRYALKLRIVPTDDAFSGTIDIEIQLKKELTTLWLNGSELTVREAVMKWGGATVATHAIEGGKDFIGFGFDRPVGPGLASLHIAFTGKVSSRDSRGLFRQQEGDSWYVISKFETHYARLAFPCFDEPSFKVPWQLTLEVKKEDLAFSNTPVVGQKEALGGFKMVEFAETKPLPSYLVALGVGPFDVVEARPAGKNRTPVRIITPKGKASDADYAAQVSPIILELLETYFGLPYPYEKLDFLSIPLPTDFGAMENAGLVTVSQTSLIAKPQDQSLQFKRGYAGLAAHELAHMWFGDLVTMAWWDDVWLNEAFATWMATKVIDQWKPDWYHHTQEVRGQSAAMTADSLVTARKVRQPIVSEHDIVTAFDGITYQKGASVLRMFEHWIGEDTFQRGIRRYLEQHAHSNATSTDFLAAISQAAGKDIAPAFSTFLDEPGVPLVSVTLRCARGKKPTLLLQQERFLPVGSTGSSKQTWQLPICARHGVGKTTGHECTLMTGKTGELELTSASRCPDWVMPNEGGRGYYRVLYEGHLARALLQGGGKQLTLPERLAVVDDLRALSRAGRVSYADLLELLPTLAKDADRSIVESAIFIASAIRWNLLPDELRPRYAAFIRKTFGPRAHQLGWLAKASDDEDTVLLRPALLSLVADAGEDAALKTQATQLALGWLGDRSSLQTDVVDGVLTVAAANGSQKLFERFHDEARKADRRDRRRLLNALGTFRDPEIAHSALAVVLSDEFDARESINIVWREGTAPKTRELAYDFVKANFEELVERLPRDSGASLAMMGVFFCDEPHRADVESFFKERASRFAGGPRRLARTLEEINLCVSLKKAQEPSIQSFFSKTERSTARRESTASY